MASFRRSKRGGSKRAARKTHRIRRRRRRTGGTRRRTRRRTGGTRRRSRRRTGGTRRRKQSGGELSLSTFMPNERQNKSAADKGEVPNWVVEINEREVQNNNVQGAPGMWGQKKGNDNKGALLWRYFLVRGKNLYYGDRKSQKGTWIVSSVVKLADENNDNDILRASMSTNMQERVEGKTYEITYKRQGNNSTDSRKLTFSKDAMDEFFNQLRTAADAADVVRNYTQSLEQGELAEATYARAARERNIEVRDMETVQKNIGTVPFREQL